MREKAKTTQKKWREAKAFVVLALQRQNILVRRAGIFLYEVLGVRKQ